MIGLDYLNEEEMNYFSEIKDSRKFQNFFHEVLKSETISSYYETYETIGKKYNKDFADKIYKNCYKWIDLVPLPPKINGFTDSSLIIFINNRKRKYVYYNKIRAEELFKFASLLITLIHESNHFIRRFEKQSDNSDQAYTSESFYTPNGKKKNELKKYEGGVLMSETLFGENLISLNIFQVLFLLDFDNWNQESACFKENFMACKKIDVEKSIEKVNKLFQVDYSEEIRELVIEAETLSKSQIVFQRILDKGELIGMEVGRCLIAIGRDKDPKYNI